MGTTSVQRSIILLLCMVLVVECLRAKRDLNRGQVPADEQHSRSITEVSSSHIEQKSKRQITGPFSGEKVHDSYFANPYGEVATANIVGGEESEPHSFYTILLYRDGGGYRWAGCGGTLISNCHILTAAHCVTHPNIRVEDVFVNAHRPFDANMGVPYHMTEVENVIVHENYNRSSYEADIAIIKMRECLDVHEFPPAMPASPIQSVPRGHMLEVFGFGKTSESAGFFNNVDVLQKARVPFIPNNACGDYYKDQITGDMVCAGFATGGIDACQGDSGGGLISTGLDGIHEQIGVVSWGSGCARDASPGVYISVRYYFNWLKIHVCNDKQIDHSNILWCSSNYHSSNNAPAQTTPNARPSPSKSPSNLPISTSAPSPTISPTSLITEANLPEAVSEDESESLSLCKLLPKFLRPIFCGWD